MPKRKKRHWNALTLVAALLACFVALSMLSSIDISSVRSRDSLRLTTAPRALSSPGPDSKGTPISLRGIPLASQEATKDQEKLDAVPYKLWVGSYSVNNFNVDFKVPSYSGAGYLWMLWQQPLQDYLESQNLEPKKLLKPVNLIAADADAALAPVGGGPRKLADGYYYQLLSYSGQFYIDQIDFRLYPFNGVGLPIVLEAGDPEGGLDFQRFRMIPELKDSGIGAYADISGWIGTGWSFAEYRHHYATNFGAGNGEKDYSQLVFDVTYGTSVWSSFWKLLQPLAVVMAMVVLLSNIPLNLGDVRLNIPVTVLLTLVFLQQSFKNSIPDLPYLTFLDKVYIIAYGITLIGFAKTVWAGRRRFLVESLEDVAEKKLIVARLDLLDNVWPVTVILVGTLATYAAWLSSH